MFGLQNRILGEFRDTLAAARRQDAQRSNDDRLLGAAGLDGRSDTEPS
jgi:probable rRNA maturation factor